MSVKGIAPGLYRVSLGIVNVFLIARDDGGVTFVDAGIKGSEGKLLGAVEAIGRRPQSVDQILVTPAHPDHVGGVPGLVAATGAEVWMHALEAEIAAAGSPHRDWRPEPGWLDGGNSGSLNRMSEQVPPVETGHTVADGDEVPPLGIRVVAAPGHTQGHVCYLWLAHGGVLFAGDAASDYRRLGPAAFYEDVEEGRRSLTRLAALDFQTACFAHGRPIVGDAGARFRKAFTDRASGGHTMGEDAAARKRDNAAARRGWGVGERHG